MFSPESEYLLQCLRASLGTAAWPAVWPSSLSEERFGQEVERHRVGAFLYSQRPEGTSAAWPPAMAQLLERSAQRTLRRGIAQTAECLRLVQRLEASGIAARVVKGPILAQQLYGGIGKRHAGDIDLLVAPEDVQAADNVLRAAGLRRTRPDFDLTPKQFRSYLRLKPEFEYLSAGSAQRVELLWRPEGLPETGEIRCQTSTANVGGHRVQILGPELTALYLFQHGARHGWFRLFWLVDIAQLLRQAPAIDWSAVMTLARNADGERAVAQGAALAGRLLAVNVPAELQSPARERRVIAALVAKALDEIACPNPEHEPTPVWARRLAYRVRLQRSARAKYRVLAPHLFTPESWRAWRLPDRWFFLYSLAGPFLWVQRRVRRARARQA